MEVDEITTDEAEMETGQEMEDDSSSSEEDEDIDVEAEKQIEAINEKLSSSPFDYQSHFDLIGLLRKIGEFEKLREARTKMAKIFPLTQNLWLNWIEDEKKFADTEDDHARIVDLFERAVKDYMCPEIWLEYAQYSIRWMGTEEGMQNIRDVMERSLTSAGLHVVKGAALWEAYREFENAIRLTMQPAPGSVPSAAHLDLIKAQTDRMLSLFKRQLSIPLIDMENTMVEFAEWCDDKVDASIRQLYEQTMKHLDGLKPLEDALFHAEPPKIEEYQNYIRHETKFGDPARIQCIYERALVENCLNSELWNQYLKYLKHKFKQGDILVQVHLRSVRNCPWTGQLWVQYLLALERNNAEKEKLTEVFNEALSAGFTSAFEYVELWRTRCEQLRRRISAGQPDTEKENLRDCFVKATQYIIENILPVFNETGDPDYTLWCFWARCEAGCLSSKVKASEILQKLLQDDADARRKLCVWKEQYDIERLYGGEDKIERCRYILRQAVQNCAIMPDSMKGGLPDAEVACGLLLDFERENGTIEDMDDSMRRVSNKMAKVMKRREKETEQYAQSRSNRSGGTNQRSKGGARKRKLPTENQSASKQDMSRSPNEQPKRTKKVEEVEASSSAKGFKAPAGLPVRYGKQPPSTSGENARKQSGPPGFKGPPPPGFQGSSPPESKVPPPGFKGPPPPGFKGPPPGFKGSTTPGFKGPPDPGFKSLPPPGFEGPLPGQSDLNNNNKTNLLKDKNEPAGDENKPEMSDDDKKTVFVSNLDFKLQNVEEKINSVFRSCGDIVDIRLAKNNKGQFRGFAFLQFADKSSVEEALKLDRQNIDGRPMFVSPNVDKRKQPNFKVFKFEVGLEKHKLFVSNLSFHTTEDTLQEEFSKHGTVKSLRIVTNRKGLSKGLAYVEYEKESDAAQAVIKMDGKEIDSFAIKVAISNPPARKAAGDSSLSALGGRGREQFKGGRGRGRTQLSMLPRNLSRTAKVANGGEEKKNSMPSTSAGGMSNKDFAKLLLKN